MKMSIKLNLDGSDIRKLRQIKGLSIATVAEKIPTTESYLSMLETGKKQLSLVQYVRILSVLNCDLQSTVCLDTMDIVNSVQSIGGFKMKKSIEIITLEALKEYLDNSKREWCIDGICAFKKLIKLYENKVDKININSNDYAIYGEFPAEPCFDNFGKTIEFDWSKFEEKLIDCCEQWTVPIKNNQYADIYLL